MSGAVEQRDATALTWWAHQSAWLADPSRFRLALKARQIGWSTVLAAEAITAAVAGETTIICAASERQSHEVLRKVRALLPVVTAAADGAVEVVRSSADCVEFSTGGRVVAIPASSATVMGFSGHVVLDEFAWHADQDALWAALVPTISSSDRYRLSVVSTPRSRGDKFHRLWENADPKVWSRHKTTIDEAVAGGCPHDVATLKAAIADETVWRSMYLCEFIDEQYALLSYDLLASCTDDSLPYHASIPSLATCGNLYVGLDIGRVRDLTVFSILEMTQDEFISRGFVEMKGAEFEAQEEMLDGIMALPNVALIVIDSTGIGLQLSERAVKRWRHRVAPVTISAPFKEDLCGRMQRAFHRGEIRVPNDRTLFADLHSVERSVTTAGNLRYAAAHSKRGHADRFIALALALRGCDRLFGVVPESPGDVLIIPTPEPRKFGQGIRLGQGI